MKKQVSTLSLIALAAFSIWQYFTEHKKDTNPAPTTTQQQSQSAVKNTKDFGNYDVIMRDDAIGQNKNAPVDYYMLALSWSLHSVKNNVRNMAIIYLIQRNINVVQKINLAGYVHAYGHKMPMRVLLRIIHVFVRVI